MASRSRRGAGRRAPSGPMGLLNRVTSTIGRTGGRGAGGGGMATKATNFVRGFMSEGSGRNRRGRPAGRRRR